ncbi:MAG: hypothetical protein EZS28_038087 [Streblomastix strix]|uniref:Uncharacterized protein n=1 Tax=Streblomastix strix TaxID=222440 RepID=A0A5J4U6B5_9EUKA|nr:MAG: hypothetical protein EZS28_038087 [Streblomastix strix]
MDLDEDDNHHLHFSVLEPGLIVVSVLMFWKLGQKVGWPAELGVGGLEEGWVCWKRLNYGKPQNCCIPGYIPNPWNDYYIYILGINCPESNCLIICVGVNVTRYGIYCPGPIAVVEYWSACGLTRS